MRAKGDYAASDVRRRLLPAEHAAGRMIRVSRYRGIRSVRAIKSFLKVDGDWQAVIGNHFVEPCNRFVPFAHLKLRFNSLLGPHDDCSRSMNNGVIGRPNRRVSICKRPQILVLVHRERSERRGGGIGANCAATPLVRVISRQDQSREMAMCPSSLTVAIPPCVDGSELARTFFTY